MMRMGSAPKGAPDQYSEQVPAEATRIFERLVRG